MLKRIDDNDSNSVHFITNIFTDLIASSKASLFIFTLLFISIDEVCSLLHSHRTFFFV